MVKLYKIALVALGFAFFLSCADNDSPNFPSEEEVAKKNSSSSNLKGSSSSGSEIGAVSSSSVVSSSGTTVRSSSSNRSSSSTGAASSSSTGAVSSSSVGAASSSSAGSSSSITIISGTFTDSRDGTIYKWVKIGTQTWMAENLNKMTANSKCHGYVMSNCNTYGMLYNWLDAANACPAGWLLPSYLDWDLLISNVGDRAATKLKAKEGWDTVNRSGKNGTDNFGFAALAGGFKFSDDSWRSIGLEGMWWSISSGSREGTAITYNMAFDDDYVLKSDESTSLYLSVRCIKND